MAIKIERWLAEVFPGTDKIYSAYESLTPREFAIVSAGVLDIALAELLSMRMVNYPGECEEFLGLDDSSRAPCKAFGARIQLALLLGLITETDAEVFRTLKNIRNTFAHRVNVALDSKEVTKSTKKLVVLLVRKIREVGSNPSAEIDFTNAFRVENPAIAMALLRMMFVFYQAYLHLLSQKLVRIEVNTVDQSQFGMRGLQHTGRPSGAVADDANRVTNLVNQQITQWTVMAG